MDLYGWIYFLGLIPAFRFHAGAILHNVTGGYGLDAEDYIMATVFGLMTMWLWPLTLAGRLVYIGVRKSGLSDRNLAHLFFPEPKAIESRAQKQARLAREQRELHEAQMRTEREWKRQAQQRTNKLEAEAGIPLTKWSN